ncbi:MAG: asparagine synthase-related protein [Acutalibacteraceae bacterium]
MRQLIGQYDLATGELCDKSLDVFMYENSLSLVRVFGCVRTENGAENDGEEIVRTVQQYGDETTQHIGGVYLLLVYSKVDRILRIFQHRTTSPVTLYYTVFDNKCYYGTSLKTLLFESGIPRALNEDALEDFIINGYLYGRDTLAKDVEKIEAFKALRVSAAAPTPVEQIAVSYPVAQMSKGEALDRWKPVLDQAIERCFEGEAEINAPLSSGYDSSYVVHVASENGQAPINAFSVGGKFGKNELPIVQENVKLYDKVKLTTALTDDNTLQNLPDIVWRLEGAVYESGLFLQYELANLVKKSGKSYLICGECADQVMNEWYLNEQRIHPEKPDGKPIYYEFSEYPYIFGSYLILKKNGILANSFGIETRYPYLDDDFVSVANAVRLLSSKDKRCHVANCRECLPKEVIANISKIGGATECHSLFNTPAEMKEFMAKVQNSAFYQAHAAMLQRHSLAATDKQTGLSAVKTAVRNAVMTILHVGTQSRKRDAYLREEMKLREYLCYTYVILFEKLILSDEYTAQFGNEGIDLKLSDLL